MTYIAESLRRWVIERANSSCEYCGLPQFASIYPHEVDHIIAEKHRGNTDADNLCLACLECNRHKGSDFGSFDPETGVIAMLYHPRLDTWNEHFKVVSGMIEPMTSIGRVTTFILQFNTQERIRERVALIEAEQYFPPQNQND